jgi:DNA recombination protein RmuC
MVIMFIPVESFLSSTLMHDPTLLEFAMERKIILATPTTLLALLKAISYGWSQEKLAQGAMKISDLGRTLYERICTLAENFNNIGKSLTATTKSYNAAIGSLEGRVLPAARKFKELGITSKKDLTAIETVEQNTRLTNSPELIETTEN